MPKLRANTTFLVSPRRFVHTGDLVDEKDPVVKGRESLFDPIEDKAPAKAVSRAAVKKAAAKKAPAVPPADG